MAKYKVTLTQRSESRFGEHSGWTHYHVGPYTEVEAEFPFTGGVVQVGSSNGSGIGYFRGYKWMPDDSIETARAYMFSGRGINEGTSSWTAPPVLRDFDLTSNYLAAYTQSSTGGYSSAADWAAGQAAWTLVNNVRTYASPSQIAYAQGYTNNLYGAFAFIWDTVDEKFVTGQDCIDNGVTIVNGYDPITGGGGRYVLAMITSAPITLVDSTPPTVTIVPVSTISLNSSNQNVTKDDPAQFTISAVDNSGGTGVKSITIDGTTYNTLSQSYSVTGGGLHTITASAEDYAGNITPNVTYDVFIDQTPPSVAIQSQNPITVSSRNYHGSSSVDIQIDTSDSDSGLDDGDLIVNGTSSVFTIVPAQTSYTTTVGSAQGVVEGLNTVEYVSKDAAGNQSTANVTFYVDTTSPDGYIVFSPQNKIRLNGGTYYTHLTNVDVDLHFGDSGSYPSGVSKGLIRINNTSTPSVSDFTSGIDLSSETSPKTSYNVTGLSVGQNNTLSFFVMDFAENISTGDTISVTVEQINPSGSIQISSLETPKITKSTTNYINDGTVELNLTHSDSESDLF